MRSFYHAGDAGDITALLPSIRQLGGGRLFIGPGFCRESMRGERFHSIAALLRQQPYIEGVYWTDTPPADCYDVSTFRGIYVKHRSLVHAQALHLGLTDVDTSPWLTVTQPNEMYSGRPVFARSSRYGNGFFPWFALLKRYPDAIFVGLPSEHMAFEAEFNCRIEYVPTRSLLELAEIIAASRLFVGNQSCPWWIACGLGATTLQETWEHDRNSMIERDNAYYMTGRCFPLDILPK